MPRRNTTTLISPPAHAPSLRAPGAQGRRQEGDIQQQDLQLLRDWGQQMALATWQMRHWCLKIQQHLQESMAERGNPILTDEHLAPLARISQASIPSNSSCPQVIEKMQQLAESMTMLMKTVKKMRFNVPEPKKKRWKWGPFGAEVPSGAEGPGVELSDRVPPHLSAHLNAQLLEDVRAKMREMQEGELT